MDRVKFFLIAAAVSVGLGWPAISRAGEPTVNLVSPVGQVQTGTIFPVEIRLDTGGVNINAAELTVRISGEASSITSLGRESSIFTLWPEPPKIAEAVGRFAGGRPGGVVAVDALVGTVSIIARQAGPVTVTLLSNSSAVYRHDGVGTKIPVATATVTIQVADDLVPGLTLTSTTHSDEQTWNRTGEIQVGWRVRPDEQFSYRLSNDIGLVPDDDLELAAGPLTFTGLEDGVWYFVIKRRLPGEPWSPVYQRRFLLDRTPPEPFTVNNLARADVGGRDLLAWTAIDRTSGDLTYRGFIDGRSIGLVESPLPLKDEWRGRRIVVVATDAAGNNRASEPWRFGHPFVPMSWWVWFVLGGILVIVVIGIARVLRRR